MVSHYTIIQYVPDPVSGERINIGIAAFSGESMKVHLLANWQRVKALCGKDFPNREWIERHFDEVDPSRLTEMIGDDSGSIQFTPLATSIQELDITLRVTSERFLIDLPLPSQPPRSHADVLSTTRDTIRAAVSRRTNSRVARAYVRTNLMIEGRFGIQRRFDLGIKNGKPILALQALSFAGTHSVDRRVEAVGFLAEEVRGKIPLTVVVAPPPTPTSVYSGARSTLEKLGAEFIDEDELPSVAYRIAEQIAHL